MSEQYTDKILDHSRKFDNAVIGKNPEISEDVIVGFRYHPKAGPARIGDNCILNKGTVIYGDVSIGDHFHTVHYSVIRAMVKGLTTSGLPNSLFLA